MRGDTPHPPSEMITTAVGPTSMQTTGPTGARSGDHTQSETERERRRFYRVKEAAAIMGVPLRTMYHLAETGQIPCRRLGTVILVPVAWVEREPLAPAKH